jgi:hypothetical protein
MGERRNRTAEVRGSIPLSSTKFRKAGQKCPAFVVSGASLFPRPRACGNSREEDCGRTGFPGMNVSKNDRRFDDRHPGTGLVTRIRDQDIEVLDVSIGGMKIPHPKGVKTWRGDMMDFVLQSTHWPEMKAVGGKAVVRAMTDDWIALQFEKPSYDLMKCVSRHVATLIWGDKPYGY